MNRRLQRNHDATQFARHQRATANEFAQDAWRMLRNRRCRNQKFRREYSIPPSIVDFCCVALKLIVEVDGEHHQTDEGRQHDQRRDQYLAEQGYQVVRIPGYEILRNAAAARRQIEKAIDERIEQRTPSSPALSPATKASTTRPRRGGEETDASKTNELPLIADRPRRCGRLQLPGSLSLETSVQLVFHGEAVRTSQPRREGKCLRHPG